MLIHLTEYLFCILRISTNQCQWWIEVILNRCTFTKELWVADNIEINATLQATFLLNNLTDLLVGTRKNG